MATKRVPAIAGVYADREAEILTIYPSMANLALARLFGQLYGGNARVGGIRSAYLIFLVTAPLMAPLAILLYFCLKVFGEKYVLTNRSVQRRAALGRRMVAQTPLSAIAGVDLEQLPGQAYFPAGELHLTDKAGKLLMTLHGVRDPDVVRQNILEACAARQQTEASLSRINARAKAIA